MMSVPNFPDSLGVKSQYPNMAYIPNFADSGHESLGVIYLTCPNMAEVSNSGDESVVVKSRYPNVASVPNFADSGVISQLP